MSGRADVGRSLITLTMIELIKMRLVGQDRQINGACPLHAR
jgi:hypothetical protein